jgi:thiol-disulfide isomerase/thioredoxin
MKKLVALISSLLLLTSCSSSTPAATQGTVVKCDAISRVESDDPKLECLDGGAGVAVSAIRGPALLNIWGTWCPPCRQELPYLAEYFENYGDQVNLIGIAVEEKSSEEVVAFVEERGMKWPILFDRDNSTRDLFGMGVPVTWFIDASGRVAHKHYGAFLSTEAIEIAVAEHLGVK